MDLDKASGECVDLCHSNREDLVKQCMNNALNNMRNGSESPIPTDSKIFSYTPSKEKYVDYASIIMKSNVPVKEISRIMVAGIIDTYSKKSRSKRRVVFDSDDDDEEVEDDIEEKEEDVRHVPIPRVTRNSSKTVGKKRSPKKKKSRTDRTARNAAIPRGARNPRNSRITRSSPRIIEVISEPEVPSEPEESIDEDDMVTEPDDMVYQDCEDPVETNVPEVSSLETNIPEVSTTSLNPYAPDTSSNSYASSHPSNSLNRLPAPMEPTTSGSMTVVSREYFPDAEFVFPGIYILPGDSGYVLFCVDNGRYSNSWTHVDGVTNLTWVTASKDKSRSALRAIADSGNVHVFRKISGETTFRYMGRVFMSDNMNRSMGTVDLSVY